MEVVSGGTGHRPDIWVRVWWKRDWAGSPSPGIAILLSPRLSNVMTSDRSFLSYRRPSDGRR